MFHARQKGPARNIFFSYDLSKLKQESITELDNLKLKEALQSRTRQIGLARNIFFSQQVANKKHLSPTNFQEELSCCYETFRLRTEHFFLAR